MVIVLVVVVVAVVIEVVVIVVSVVIVVVVVMLCPLCGTKLLLAAQSRLCCASRASMATRFAAVVVSSRAPSARASSNAVILSKHVGGVSVYNVHTEHTS